MSSVDLDTLRVEVTKQASKIRQLKADGVEANIITEEVAKLSEYKKQLNDALAATANTESEGDFNKEAFNKLLQRGLFVIPAFEIYNGVKGLYDFGPPACALKTNVLNLWRKHFVLEDNMLEIECTNLTPECVLKTSGHVDRFSDFMVKDISNGECFRADKLLEAHIDNMLNDITLTQSARAELEKVRIQAGAYSQEEIGKIIKDMNIVSPSSGSPLSDPYPFNLMFKTTIGPEGTAVGFLRPETAQGIFVNFRRLYDYNATKMPFACAQVGIGFRNEIAPRSGLLRVREFPMAEIEHFCNPNDKSCAKFINVKDDRLPLFPRDHQLGDGKLVTPLLGVAVAESIINNETLAYFMARTYSFLVAIGVDPARIRFRQHLKTEMAHYASDCWDAEIKLSYGWTECVGIADRSCYDLVQHSKATKQDHFASEKFEKPQEVKFAKAEMNSKEIGKLFKKDQNTVKEALVELGEKSPADAIAAQEKLNTTGSFDLDTCAGVFKISKDMVKFEATTKLVHETKYTPAVIEPSFGIGRILYAVMEHSFYIRDMDENRTVMAFKPVVAPYKVSLLPLSNSKNPEMIAVADDLNNALTALSISCKVDISSAAIGRRYARTDELGLPFAITIDFQTIDPKHALFNTVTLRERESMHQVRIHIKEVSKIIADLCNGKITYTEVSKIYPSSEDALNGAEVKLESIEPIVTTSRVEGGLIDNHPGVIIEGNNRTCGRFSRPKL